jgi:Zn-finger domain-containing protein
MKEEEKKHDNTSKCKELLNKKRIRFIDKSDAKNSGPKRMIQDWWEEATLKNLQKKQETIAKNSNLILNSKAFMEMRNQDDINQSVLPSFSFSDEEKRKGKEIYTYHLVYL